MIKNKKINIKNHYTGPKCIFCKVKEDVFSSYSTIDYIKECILDIGRV